MRKFALPVVFVLGLILAFAAGSYLTRRNMTRGIGAMMYETQAMLWFNHLHQFREIESDLLKGCEKEALERRG
jgi:hypothetical protein